MLLADLRESVLEAAVEMERLGLTRGTSGNVSSRDPGTGLVAITPSGLPYSSLAPADVTVVDLSGEVVEGTRPPSSETPMHTAIYRVNRDVSAVVHTHSPFATAFAVMNRGLPEITVPLALLGGAKVLPFQSPGSAALASLVATAVESGDRCVLLQNHGVVCVARSLREALEAAVYVEEGAQVGIYALSAGGPLTPIPRDAALEIRSRADEARAV